MVKKEPSAKSVYLLSAGHLLYRCKIGFFGEKSKGFFGVFGIFFENASNNLYVDNYYMFFEVF